MSQQFSPITLGQRLKTVNAGAFVLTETTHRPNHRLPRHNHEGTNIAFVLNGSFTEILDRRSIECNPQSFLTKPAGESHANRYGRTGMRCLLMEVSPQQLETFHPWSKALEQVRHDQATNLSVLGMRIYKEFRLMDHAAPLAIEGLMLEILAALSRGSNHISEWKSPRWLEQAKEMLHAHFHESLSLASIAKAVDVHPVHLTRMFRKHLACTPGEYVRQLRIAFASRKLSDSDAPLVEIALAAGFTHQSHFSRIFKTQTGMTPSEFRAAMRSR